uniref:Uncharacterized protein n=1 Tax=Oryza rufipogon TaxID=4529 RepID=A0A0E0NYD3_ORYRU
MPPTRALPCVGLVRCGRNRACGAAAARARAQRGGGGESPRACARRRRPRAWGRHASASSRAGGRPRISTSRRCGGGVPRPTSTPAEAGRSSASSSPTPLQQGDCLEVLISVRPIQEVASRRQRLFHADM